MKQIIKGFIRALNDSGRFQYKNPDLVVDYLVIGGGVVGLAVAQRLCQRFPTKSTYLLERHSRAGGETSSRNSEVIHAGLYYPPESLKTKLCLRGRDLMYGHCRVHNIPCKQTGKLVVARKDQRSYVENLHRKSMTLRWPSQLTMNDPRDQVLPTQLLSGGEARSLEPDLSNDIVTALWCPKTGIVDSHSFMQSLEKDIIDSEGGELVFSSNVVRIDPYLKSAEDTRMPCFGVAESGWTVQIASGADREETHSILARTVINAAGLSSTLTLNSILPKDARIPIYFARGSYAAYRGPGVSNVSHLIYPCPETGPNAHAFESLGTHLTLDLQGNVRFGPDIQWLLPPETPGEATEEDVNFWNRMLTPDDSILPGMCQAVTKYLPGVTIDGLKPDYVGIRPKLIPPGGGFQDFVFRTDFPDVDAKRSRCNPMVSLLGIESPGLTSSLAIAEMVVEEVLPG